MSARLIRLAALGVAVILLMTPACDTVPIGSDDTDGGVLPASTSVVCTADAECVLIVDYCAAICGVCRAVVGAATPVSRCMVPPNVSCKNPCPGERAVCQAGRCTVR